MTFDIAWTSWAPVYAAIMDDLGYDRAADERARDELREACDPALLPRELPDATGRDIVIVGGGPIDADGHARIDRADLVFAASTATATLDETGTRVDLHVTDLDKDVASTVQRTQDGQPVALHAHGDNRDALREHLPRMDTRYVLPTTQVRARAPVRNPGGFTDGDRAAFLADALGARSLSFAGWDFEDPTVSEEKRRKLEWAARLLGWLEAARDTRFELLDGRRDGSDIAAFPPLRRDD